MIDNHQSSVFLKSLLEKIDGVRQVSSGLSLEESVCSTAAFLFEKNSAVNNYLVKNKKPGKKLQIGLGLIDTGRIVLEDIASVLWKTGLFLSGQRLSSQSKKMDDINRHDYQFLALFSTQGYYESIPWVHNEIKEDSNKDRGTSVTTFMDGTGHMLVKNFSNLLPKDLFTITKDKPTTWDRWLILLHETAHCALRTEDDWFSPTPGYFSKDPLKDKACVDVVNTWTIGLKKASDSVGKKSDNHNAFCARAVDEAFADAFASMMLLKESQFNEGALASVSRMQASRQITKDDTDKVMSGLIHPENDFRTFAIYAPSSTSLRYLLDNRDDWKDLSPLDMKQKAKEYASNALMDYINPRRKMLSDTAHIKKSPPSFFLKSLIPSGGLNLKDNIYAIVSTEFAHPASEDTLSPRGFERHPLASFLKDEATGVMKTMIGEFHTEQEGYARLRIFFDDYSHSEISGPSVEVFQAVQKGLMGADTKTVFDIPDEKKEISRLFRTAQTTVESHVKSIFEQGYQNAPVPLPDPSLSVACLRQKRQERLQSEAALSPVAFAPNTP